MSTNTITLNLFLKKLNLMQVGDTTTPYVVFILDTSHFYDRAVGVNTPTSQHSLKSVYFAKAMVLYQMEVLFLIWSWLFLLLSICDYVRNYNLRTVALFIIPTRQLILQFRLK